MKRSMFSAGLATRRLVFGGSWSVSLAGAVALLGWAAPAGAGLIINPTYDSTITSDPNAATIEAGINATIARVESQIANSTTVNITFAETSSGLGESSTPHYTIPYATYVNALLSQQSLSPNETTAIASLGYVPGVTTTNPVNGNGSVYVQTALARALNIANYTGSDGTVDLNTSIMNLSRTGTQNSGFYDLQAVAGHEIDEVLGIGGPGSALPTTTGPVGVLDLYRYSSPGVRSFTTSTSAAPYFSINGGVTDLVHFNQDGGGSDYADWGDGVSPADGRGNSPAQLQDAFGSPGVDVNIGANEVTALNVVGYELTPEPSSVSLLAIAGAGLLSRRRRSAKAQAR